MGQSAAEIILGLAQLDASRGATNVANRRLDIEEDEKRKIQNRSDAQIKKAEDKEIARLASGATGLAFGAPGVVNYRTRIEEELKQGLITYEDAKGALEGYGSKFELNPEEAVRNLTTLYTKDILPGRNAAAAAAAYKELMGTDITDEQKKDAADLFQSGYYKDVQALKNSIIQSPAYKDKFQTSYLGNYYDTIYGEEQRDDKGKRTGKRAFKFDSSLLPKYAAGTEGKAGVSIPTFKDEFLNVADIENREQSIRDTRKYLYSAGLTNLQGDIDKETQKLKNEGARDLALISQAGDKYKLMGLAFS